MKVTLDWLRDYVDFDLPAEEIADRLTQAGLETEGIERVGDETVIELETTSNSPRPPRGSWGWLERLLGSVIQSLGSLLSISIRLTSTRGHP